MDFSWSEQQQLIYRETLGFARQHLTRAEPASPWAPASPRWIACGRQGLLGLSAPEDLGGSGLDALTTARAIEALGKGSGDMGLAFAVSAHLFACVMPLVEHGSDQLRRKLVPGLCSGLLVGANAITEAEAGSDVHAMAARAERSGDTYILNGVKSYVTNGPLADVTIVYAKTDATAGYLGITAFAIERGTEGFHFGQPFDKMGLHAAPIASLYLKDCRVPIANRLGEEGAGAQVFRSSMQWERACLFAAYLGQMDRLLELTVEYAGARRQFGKRIGAFQGVSHRIGDMKLRLEAARLLLYKACWSFDHGTRSTLDISLAKLAVSQAAIQSGLDAIQIHGGAGYAAGAEFERQLRDAIPSTIFSGTSEVLKDIVARELGL